jgi:hypothetical protein
VLVPNVPYEKLNQGLQTGLISRLFKILDGATGILLFCLADCKK